MLGSPTIVYELIGTLKIYDYYKEITLDVLKATKYNVILRLL